MPAWTIFSALTAFPEGDSFPTGSDVSFLCNSGTVHIDDVVMGYQVYTRSGQCDAGSEERRRRQPALGIIQSEFASSGTAIMSACQRRFHPRDRTAPPFRRTRR